MNKFVIGQKGQHKYAIGKMNFEEIDDEGHTFVRPIGKVVQFKVLDRGAMFIDFRGLSVQYTTGINITKTAMLTSELGPRVLRGYRCTC